MNEETNSFLKNNLEEAHAIFNTIISEMKDNNITFAYKELEVREMNSYQEINDMISKMNYYVMESNNLKEKNIELFNTEYSLYLKYFSLYVISLLFIRIYHEIIDTRELNDMIKYIVGMFLGSTYIGLLNKDLNDNKNDNKEKRDLINKLKTMKEEYKKNHDIVVNEIDTIFAVNDGLWSILDTEKIKNK